MFQQVGKYSDQVFTVKGPFEKPALISISRLYTIKKKVGKRRKTAMVFQPASVWLEGQLPNKWGLYKIHPIGPVPLPVLHIHHDILVHDWSVLPYCLSTVCLSHTNLLFSQHFPLCASVTLNQAKTKYLLPLWSTNSIYGHTEVVVR